MFRRDMRLDGRAEQAIPADVSQGVAEGVVCPCAIPTLHAFESCMALLISHVLEAASAEVRGYSHVEAESKAYRRAKNCGVKEVLREPVVVGDGSNEVQRCAARTAARGADRVPDIEPKFGQGVVVDGYREFALQLVRPRRRRRRIWVRPSGDCVLDAFGYEGGVDIDERVAGQEARR